MVTACTEYRRSRRQSGVQVRRHCLCGRLPSLPGTLPLFIFFSIRQSLPSSADITLCFFFKCLQDIVSLARACSHVTCAQMYIYCVARDPGFVPIYLVDGCDVSQYNSRVFCVLLWSSLPTAFNLILFLPASTPYPLATRYQYTLRYDVGVRWGQVPRERGTGIKLLNT